jgi:hypothetical protein
VELGHDDEALFFLGVSLVLAFGALWLSGRLAERMATGGPS